MKIRFVRKVDKNFYYRIEKDNLTYPELIKAWDDLEKVYGKDSMSTSTPSEYLDEFKSQEFREKAKNSKYMIIEERGIFSFFPSDRDTKLELSKIHDE